MFCGCVDVDSWGDRVGARSRPQECAAHPRALVMTSSKSERSVGVAAKSQRLAKYPSSVDTRENVELWVLLKIIKGAVRPLGPV